MIRAVVFDFDGVIADSEPLHFTAFRDVLDQQGVELAKSDYYDRYLGYDDVGVFRAVSGDRRLNWSDDRIAALVRRKAIRLEASYPESETDAYHMIEYVFISGFKHFYVGAGAKANNWRTGGHDKVDAILQSVEIGK